MLQRYLHRLSVAKILCSNRLHSALTGVNGYTGRGDVEFSAWKNGTWRIEVSLRGVAGLAADIYADDSLVEAVPVKNGKVDCRYERNGGEAQEFRDGTKIEVRQNDNPILEGVLRERRKHVILHQE